MTVMWRAEVSVTASAVANRSSACIDYSPVYEGLKTAYFDGLDARRTCICHEPEISEPAHELLTSTGIDQP
jgi:hypothetical protein